MNVPLERKWTDPAGVTHDRGECVDVDAATLAKLEADGIVTAPDDPPERRGEKIIYRESRMGPGGSVVDATSC